MQLAAALFLMGLASGLHCLGMCGGIATAFPARKVLFNLGRIATYASLGLLAGSIGATVLPGQAAVQVAFGIVLLLVGLQLAGLRTPLRWVESLGAPLWRRVQPLAIRFAKQNSFLAGMAWGFVPCGLVYAAAAASAFSQSALGGALGMVAFGLGTLPWLLAAGVLTARLRGWLRLLPVRLLAGGAVAASGAWGVIHPFLGVHA